MKKLKPLLSKDTIIFLGGLLGVSHETLLTHAERPTLLILFAAMMGLPAFLSSGAAEEKIIRKKLSKEDNKKKEDESASDSDDKE